MNITRRIAALAAVGLIAAAGSLGLSAAAHATEVAPTTKVVAWYTPDLANRWAVPQKLAANTTDCGPGKPAGWQVDTYRYDTPEHIATVDALIAKGTLLQGEDSSVWISNVDIKQTACGPTTIPAPTLTVTPPTCEADGTLPFLSNPPAQNANGYEFPGQGYRVYIAPAYSGPGTYTATIQKVGPGFDAAYPYGTKLTGTTTQVLTVEAATGYQHTDAAAPCYDAPPAQPADKVTVVTTAGTPDCTTGTVENTRTTTTVAYVYDAATNTWVEGEPVVTTEVIPSKATVEDCPPVVTPPTDEPTPPTTEPTPPVVEPTPPADTPEQPTTVVHTALDRTASTATPEASGSLAYTGTNTAPMAIGGGVLLLAGALLLLTRLRRRA